VRMQRVAMFVLGLVAILCAPARADDRVYCPPPEAHVLKRFHPVGGWHPAGGFLHWWDPHCFPQWCGPDDYCRKPFPNVCRPSICPSSALGGSPGRYPGVLAK
jgi:hypothetical protein